MELKKISVCYLEGELDGVRTAVTVASKSLRAVAFPRELLRHVRKEGKIEGSVLPTLEQPGVYVLIGQDDKQKDKASVYIGQSLTKVGDRLSQHDRDNKKKKPWWTDTIALVRDDKDLPIGLMLVVESKLIRSIGVNPRWISKQNNPGEEAGGLSTEERSVWKDIVPNAKKIIEALGWDIFRNFAGTVSINDPELSPKEPDSPMFECKGKGYRAKMYIVDSEQFVVEEKSTARTKTTSTIRPSVEKERNELIRRGMLRKAETHLVFTVNHTFSSAWKAASVVSGRPIDGDSAWKMSDGTTYGVWKGKQSSESKKRDDFAAEGGDARHNFSDVIRNDEESQQFSKQPINQKSNWISPEFSIDLDNGNAAAYMQINDKGKYVVKAESKANLKFSINEKLNSPRRIRDRIIKDGVLIKQGDRLVFINDHPFSSGWSSACVIRGKNVNGKTAWKLPNGNTLGQWQNDQKRKIRKPK